MPPTRMKITEYENDLKYDVPPMLCDKVIRDSIKNPLPNMTHYMGVIGKPGSGKSSLMITMLTHPDMYHKCFHNVFVCMPKTSRSSLAGDPFKDHPEEKLFDELTPHVLQYVLEYCRIASEEKQWSLLILDDCAAELKNKEVERVLKHLIWNRRHLKLSIWIMSQSYNAMPLSIRKALSHAVMFKPANKKELEAVFSELIFHTREQQEVLSHHCFPEGAEGAHNFLFLDCNKSHVHKNFNRIQLQDN
jgi:hypothetical protein